jgi:hypothetical protein
MMRAFLTARRAAPLLTLDRPLRKAADKIGVRLKQEIRDEKYHAVCLTDADFGGPSGMRTI